MVEKYARMMAAGEWRETGEPIIFSTDGRLFNGQHRLLACIKAGVAFSTAVARNVTVDSHSAFDTGVMRTLADELAWMGVSSQNVVAAVIYGLWRFEQGCPTDLGAAPTKPEGIAIWRHESDLIRAAVTHAERVRRATRINATALGVVYVLIARGSGRGVAEEWFDHLERGTDYVPHDPALTLRNHALNVAGAKRVRLRQSEWLALIIKATNAWIEGRPLRTLRWRSVGRHAEAFPTLVCESPD
jgi:hypothetical protein